MGVPASKCCAKEEAEFEASTEDAGKVQAVVVDDQPIMAISMAISPESEAQITPVEGQVVAPPAAKDEPVKILEEKDPLPFTKIPTGERRPSRRDTPNLQSGNPDDPSEESFVKKLTERTLDVVGEDEELNGGDGVIEDLKNATGDAEKQEERQGNGEADSNPVVRDGRTGAEDEPWTSKPQAQHKDPPALNVEFAPGVDSGGSGLDMDRRMVSFVQRPLGVDFEPTVPLVVKALAPGGHAEELGVQAGWEFKTVDGIALEGMPYHCVMQMIQHRSSRLPSREALAANENEQAAHENENNTERAAYENEKNTRRDRRGSRCKCVVS